MKHIAISTVLALALGAAASAKELSLSDLAPGRYGYVDPKSGQRGSYTVAGQDPSAGVFGPREKPLPLEYLPLVLKEQASKGESGKNAPVVPAPAAVVPAPTDGADKPKVDSGFSLDNPTSPTVGGSQLELPKESDGMSTSEPAKEAAAGMKKEEEAQKKLPKIKPETTKTPKVTIDKALKQDTKSAASTDGDSKLKWLGTPFSKGKGFFKGIGKGVGKGFGSGYGYLFDGDGGGASKPSSK